MPRKSPASSHLPTRLVTTKFVNTTCPRQSAVRKKRTVAGPGTTGPLYAGNGADTNTPANGAAVSQYDVACFKYQ
jgi:hypothetical protein